MNIVNRYAHAKLFQCIRTDILSSRVRGEQKRYTALLYSRDTDRPGKSTSMSVRIMNYYSPGSNDCPDVGSATTRTEPFKIWFGVEVDVSVSWIILKVTLSISD